MKLLNYTLRDDANIAGNSFNARRTRLILEGLIRNNITLIEYGNCLGIGSYENDKSF